MRDTYWKSAIAVAVGSVVVALASCGGSPDLSYTNPDWRQTVGESVTFPLPQPITLTVGLADRMSPPREENPTLHWIREATNISLRFVAIPSSPGDVEFGQMIRSGTLPDIIAEGRVDLNDASIHQLFVDFLEFRELTPRFAALIRSNEAVRAGALARLTTGGKLLSLGTYDPDQMPFAGVLAYREDLFLEHGLSAETWEDLRAALLRLKQTYPNSYPFGGRFQTMLELMPSWFGSGYDPRHIVYYDTTERRWVFGPFEDGFEDFVVFLAESYAAGLVDPNSVVAREDVITRSFTNNLVFLAPFRGPTGPFFRFAGSDYGAVTDDGRWDGNGRWVSSLPLPPAPNGEPRWVSTQRFSPVGPGWLVYTQGEHVGEAIALLDLLFSPRAAAVLALGPPGGGWVWTDGGVSLSETMRRVYEESGVSGLRSELGGGDADSLGIPLSGLGFDFYGSFGYPHIGRFRYYVRQDLAANRPHEDVMVEVGVRVPSDDEEFNDARINSVVSLQGFIESQVANFMVGRRPVSEYDEFVDEARAMGAERLVNVYNEKAVVPPPEALGAYLD